VVMFLIDGERGKRVWLWGYLGCLDVIFGVLGVCWCK